MPRRLTGVLAVFVALALLVGGGLPATAKERRFRIIVHPTVQGSQIPREILSAIFLRSSRQWGNGEPIEPADQSVRSPVRIAFTLDVHERSMVEIQVLWQRQVMAGVTPPPVKTSDEDVIAFVASTQGAIGCIAAETPLPGTVRTLTLLD